MTEYNGNKQERKRRKGRKDKTNKRARNYIIVPLCSPLVLVDLVELLPQARLEPRMLDAIRSPTSLHSDCPSRAILAFHLELHPRLPSYRGDYCEFVGGDRGYGDLEGWFCQGSLVRSHT